MEPVYLFDLASRHADWASIRQTVVTGNIANANTAGFEASDIEPFADVLDQTSLTMASTRSGHLSDGDAAAQSQQVGAVDSWEVKSTGQSVSLDKELVKADEVNRAYSLDASIVRAFHGMLMTSIRSGG